MQHNTPTKPEVTKNTTAHVGCVGQISPTSRFLVTSVLFYFFISKKKKKMLEDINKNGYCFADMQSYTINDQYTIGSMLLWHHEIKCRVFPANQQREEHRRGQSRKANLVHLDMLLALFITDSRLVTEWYLAKVPGDGKQRQRRRVIAGHERFKLKQLGIVVFDVWLHLINIESSIPKARAKCGSS